MTKIGCSPREAIKKLTIMLSLGGTAALLTAPSPAAATNLHSYVSATGMDSNACTVTAPCQTIGHAVTQTASGGGVHCLDSGIVYSGGIVISQSITIDCAGTSAASLGVYIGTPGIVVTL